MSKNSQPLLSPTQFVMNMNESIGNSTTGEAIDRNSLLLQEYFFGPQTENGEHFKLLKEIRHAISTPALQSNLEKKWDDEAYNYDPETYIRVKQVRYACLYIELAKSAEAQNDQNRAWAFINYSSIMVGEVVGRSASILSALEANRCAKQKSENGKGRIKNFLPVKEEAARLLVVMKPEGGWPTLVSALTALEQPLGDFINANSIGGVKSSNTYALLEKNWIHNDEVVNRAWLNTKRDKNTK